MNSQIKDITTNSNRGLDNPITMDNIANSSGVNSAQKEWFASNSSSKMGVISGTKPSTQGGGDGGGNGGGNSGISNINWVPIAVVGGGLLIGGAVIKKLLL